MDLVTLMTLKLTAQEVGSDEFGNRYYEERRARPGKLPRRYVRYNGIVEASKVPADWHGWLHYTESYHHLQRVAIKSTNGRGDTSLI